MLSIVSYQQSVLIKFGLSAIVIYVGFCALCLYLSIILQVEAKYFFTLTTVFCGFLLVSLISFEIYASLKEINTFKFLVSGLVIWIFARLSISLATSSFSVDDEIYSWNMWAVQNYLGQRADYFYTHVPYPQALPLWLASIYRSLGGVDCQAIPRFFLATTGFIYLVAVSHCFQIKNFKHALVSIAIVLLIWNLIGIGEIFSHGFADPLMAASLLVSVLLFIEYSKTTNNIIILVASAGCAIVAVYSKQPAMIWGIGILPFLTIIGVFRSGWPKQSLLIVFLSALICLYWPLGPGAGFQDNNGVITRSLQNRSIIQQIIFSVDRFLLKNTGFLVLLILSYWSCRKQTIHRALWLLLFVPMLLSWFIWGSYTLRLGVHVIGLAGLLLMSSYTESLGVVSLPINRQIIIWPVINNSIFFRKKWMTALLLTLALCVYIEKDVFRVARRERIDLAHGGWTTLSRQYGSDYAPFIYEKIYKKKAMKVWSTTNYTYGVFFGHVISDRPHYTDQFYGRENLLRDLVESAPDYAIYAGKVPFGPASELLKKVAENCQSIFKPVVEPPNEYGFIIYSIDKNKLRDQQCS